MRLKKCQKFRNMVATYPRLRKVKKITFTLDTAQDHGNNVQYLYKYIFFYYYNYLRFCHLRSISIQIPYPLGLTGIFSVIYYYLSRTCLSGIPAFFGLFGFPLNTKNTLYISNKSQKLLVEKKYIAENIETLFYLAVN